MEYDWGSTVLAAETEVHKKSTHMLDNLAILSVLNEGNSTCAGETNLLGAVNLKKHKTLM